MIESHRSGVSEVGEEEDGVHPALGPGVHHVLDLSVLRRWDAFLALDVSEKTRTMYRRAMGWFVMDAFIDPLTATEDDLVEFLADIPRKGSKRGQIIRAWRHFFPWAQGRGLRPDDPTIRLSVPTEKYGPPPYLTPEELTRLVLGSMQSGDPRRPWGILFVYGVGARIGAACRVDPDRDVKGNLVYFRGDKGAKDRAVPMGPTAREAVRELVALRDWMPPKTRERRPTLLGVGPARFRQWLERAARQAELHAYPHLLRHTYGTQLSENGVVVEVIQELMGHEDIRVTRRYVAVRDPRIVAGAGTI